MNIISLLLIIAIVVNSLLAIFVYVNNRKKLINIFFSITIAGAAFWDLCIFLYRNSSIETLNFWFQATYFSACFPVVFLLFFSFIFPFGTFPKNIFARGFLVISTITFFTVTLIPRFIAKEHFFVGDDLYTVFGIGYYIHSIIVIIFYTWVFRNFYIKFKISEGITKSQLLYLTIGSFFTFSMGIITNLIIYPFTTKYSWVGPASTIFLSISVAYAITRYRFMDIKVVLRRGAVAFTTFIVLAVIFSGAVILLSIFLKHDIDTPSFLIIVIVASLSFLLNNTIREQIIKIFNKVFFAPLYDKEVVLNKLAKKIPEVLNLEELVNLISSTTQNILQIEKLSLWSINKNRRGSTLLKSIGFEFKDMDYFVNDMELISYFLAYNDPIIYHEIGKIPENQGGIVYVRILNRLKDEMKLKKIDAIIPLIFKRNIIGMIFLGKKVDDTSYTREDINTLKIIASQSAVAIDNAGLYQEVQQFASQMEKEVRKATFKLRNVNKQLTKLDKAKSEFISIASHQLRTPLSAIKGYASMILDGDYGKINQSVKPAIDRIFIGANRMSSLVENLLNVSRIESGRIVFNMRNIDFRVIVESMVNKFSVMARNKKLNLIYSHRGNNFFINADEIKIMEVVYNIIDNAIKYTEKGEVEITLETTKKGKKAIILSVRDSGIGIEAEDFPNIFQKFRRGKKVALLYTDGLGLGLFFSQKIVEAHKGKIWAESAGENKGSTFYVKFPV